MSNSEYIRPHLFGLSVKRSVSVAVCILAVITVLFPSCDPEARWETKDVNITMNLKNFSAGFVECDFATDKEAYYLIACQPVREGVNPMEHQKQFMMLALDSANVEYLSWRNALLKQGEFNVAPFSSHALQYGAVNKLFTGLTRDTDYWIYAFVVNPETMEPAGQLYLMTVHTSTESRFDIHFAYRVKGLWDYTYPLDENGNINSHYPYIATTRDSAAMGVTEEEILLDLIEWIYNQFNEPDNTNVLYGVRAVENDGWQSSVAFEQDHTYYTCIADYDGMYDHCSIYKFVWTGDSCNYFFHDTDSANIILKYFGE